MRWRWAKSISTFLRLSRETLSAFVFRHSLAKSRASSSGVRVTDRASTFGQQRSSDGQAWQMARSARYLRVPVTVFPRLGSE
jgi:hypothetical protein